MPEGREQDAQEILDQANALVEEVEAQEQWVRGEALVTRPGKRIVAKYARIPTTSLSQDFMVHQTEPIAFVSGVISLSAENLYPNNDGDMLEALKVELLTRWHREFASYDEQARSDLRARDLGWMLEVDSVELIECDLLVPKK